MQGYYGIGTQKAKGYFEDRTFPRISEDMIADKEAVRLWWQGLYRKNEKDTTLGMLLIEIRKNNKLLEQLFSERKEEEKIC